jgi:hyperosmotically inducible periplasmic protein
MSTFTKTMGAATVGGLLVYFLDPETGKKRRSVVRDRSVKLVKDADRAIEKASRDLSNRARGAVAEARSLVPLRAVSDEVLVEQVRSRIGRVTSFPHFLEVSAREGAVSLRGAVLESEIDNLLSAVSSTRHVGLGS